MRRIATISGARSFAAGRGRSARRRSTSGSARRSPRRNEQREMTAAFAGGRARLLLAGGADVAALVRAASLKPRLSSVHSAAAVRRVRRIVAAGHRGARPVRGTGRARAHAGGRAASPTPPHERAGGARARPSGRSSGVARTTARGQRTSAGTRAPAPALAQRAPRHDQPALRARLDLERAAVRLGHGAHDRQPQPGAARRRPRGQALERLGQPRRRRRVTGAPLFSTRARPRRRRARARTSTKPPGRL